MAILHNPENDSYGFRISVRPTVWGSMQKADPNIQIRRDVLKYIQEQDWDPDLWYEHMVPSVDENGTVTHFDYWFATRNMALMTRLVAS
jgi:hypothetical protein